MNYNYHTHTKYCRHAEGEMEEYVMYAMEHGIRYLGFSEHAPFVFPDGCESFFRLLMENVPDYLAECKRLREKYKDRLDLKIGYEMEYYPLHFPTMLKTALECEAEYLILGQHFSNNEHPNGAPTAFPVTDDAVLTEFADCVVKAIQSGVFTYVAHPDVLNYQGKNEALYEKEMEKICIASKEYNIPLEINFGGARDKCHYPGDRFFAIAGKVGCPITMGMDAHNVTEAYDKENLLLGKEMIKRHNLNYIGKPNLILLQENKDEILKKFSLT